jgi:hypothetical protein
MVAARRLKVGDQVRVERDERWWPSRGSWPRYRGRVGTVVTRRHFGEIGVRFGAGHVLSYFRPHELVPADAPEAAGHDPRAASRRCEDTGGGS